MMKTNEASKGFQLPRPLRWLWGDMSLFEIKKFSFLALLFMSIVGGYWMLRPLKDGIFKLTVGVKYMPYARMLSLVFIIPLILLYAKLVDLFRRHWLLYLICSAFGATFTTIAVLLQFRPDVPASPANLLGWFTFVVIESYGSITVSLFWSFVAITTKHQSAARGYSLVVTGGQVGSIIGPTITIFTDYLSLPLLMLMASGVVFLSVFLTWLYMTLVEIPYQRDRLAAANAHLSSSAPRIVGQLLAGHGDEAESGDLEANAARKTINADSEQADDHDEADSKHKTTPGFFVGLKLLLAEPYLLGIFGITTIYEVIGTVMDFQMKSLADLQLDTQQYTSFLSKFGVAVNTLSLLLALFGTSSLLRKLGLRACLLVYPFSVAISLFLILLYPNIMAIFWAQVMLKGVSYALNNPAKEILYLPTNPDIKFKVKSWCDMFGGTPRTIICIEWLSLSLLRVQRVSSRDANTW